MFVHALYFPITELNRQTKLTIRQFKSRLR